MHVEVALNALRELLGPEIKFDIGKPVVEFRETVTEPSSMICLGKSSNKHNRVYFTAQPLDADLVKELENLTLSNDPKVRSQQLTSIGLDANDAKKVWYFLSLS